MAGTATYHVTGFRWFREVLWRTTQLVEQLEGMEIDEQVARQVRSLRATLNDSDAGSDDSESDLSPP